MIILTHRKSSKLKGDNMAINCLPEKISKAALGVIFTLLGLGMVALGLTLMPIFGLLFAVPFFVFAVYFFRIHLSEKCEITTDT
jgi:hypothetical protein